MKDSAQGFDDFTHSSGLVNFELAKLVYNQLDDRFSGSVKPKESQTKLNFLLDTGCFVEFDSLSRKMSQLVLLLGPCRVLVHQSPPVQYMTHTRALLHYSATPTPSPTSYKRDFIYIIAESNQL